MALGCVIFGHSWVSVPGEVDTCKRCSANRYAVDQKYRNNLDRSRAESMRKRNSEVRQGQVYWGEKQRAREQRISEQNAKNESQPAWRDHTGDLMRRH